MGEIIRRTKGDRFLGWYLRYVDADGKRKQRASHQPTKELARRMLVEIEARVARGLVGIAEPPPSLTIAELADRFLAEYSRPKIKDLDRYRASARVALGRLLPLLNQKQAEKIASNDVAKARDALSRSHSPASVNLSLAFIGKMFAWAVAQGIVAHNPVRGVERPQTEASIDFFSRAEVESILATAKAFAGSSRRADRMLACCVHFALHTGLRKGELLGLRWRDLDLDTRRLTVAKSYFGTPKNGKTRHLSLPAACVPALRAWLPACPTTPDGLVFPVSGGGSWSKKALLGFPRLLTAASVRVPVHPWHVCRHTYASHFVMQGGNLLTLQKILGHSDVKMTMIYAHLSPDFIAVEMDRLQFTPQEEPPDNEQ